MLINALRPEYRVIAPDHMGCGLSDKPESNKYDYSLEQRVGDLEQLLDKLGISTDITLVMHDWGGPIGMGYAGRHVQAINRLVVLNTAAFPLPSGKHLHWSLRIGRNLPFGVLLIRGLNLMVLGAAYFAIRREKSDAVMGHLITLGEIGFLFSGLCRTFLSLRQIDLTRCSRALRRGCLIFSKYQF
jgi:haloalkane dehalogenase